MTSTEKKSFIGVKMMKIESIKLLNFGALKTKNESLEENKNSPTGYFLYADDVEFTETTAILRAKKKLKFGIKYLVKGDNQEGDNLVFFYCKIIHPEITNPDTNQRFSETTERKSCYLNETNFDYLHFEHDWEVQKGTYIFQIFDENSMLVEKEFVLI